MKRFVKKLVLFVLKVLAKRRVKRFKGKVIVVTGSVGKTSTKDAIFTILNTQYKVKKSKKSMNTDFGLLLTILDIESGFSSAIKWSWVLVKGLFNSLFRDLSDVWLFEFGVDKPKDMDFLISVVKPDIAVMTNIFPVHLDFGQFKNLQDIFEEKKKIVDALKRNGTAVLNIDNPFLADLAKSRGKREGEFAATGRGSWQKLGNPSDRLTITFSKDDVANYYATNIKLSEAETVFILHHKDKRYEVPFPVLGEYQVYAAMAAIICGELMGISLENSILALQRFSLPAGRMSVIAGKNGSTILDSSYNSSPEALKEALKILKSLGEGKRKIAVLGNMNELGENSRALHHGAGGLVPSCADLLITVGVQAKVMAEAAMEKGMDEKSVHSFDSATAAADFFTSKIKEGDLILVKGSQNNVRLEKFVKAMMAHPEDAKSVLVRQEKVWEKM
ncbi:UDP-N-acetylmuramoyl-tripeptide--D-alanyl-D-alanine ligase [Candidatus Peregrinibacteria bacterium]|nr:UDP-N-acetylmuramoyl-tripeptide--D-alanyl-D-alanine ligase [Candidatus Peregrinibacteria bacterium]